MKVAIKQSAMPASTTTQDFTDTGFASDVKLFMPYLTRATANDTIANDWTQCVGAYDNTRQWCLSIHEDHNRITSTLTDSRDFLTNAACMADTITTTSIAEGAASNLSTGGRITWSDIDNLELVNGLLLGGSDVEASVVHGTLNGTTPVSVTHNLSGAPDVIIAYTMGAAEAGTTAQRWSQGFYDVASNTYVCNVQRSSSGDPTTIIDQAIYTTYVAASITATLVWGVTLSSIGSTTFSMAASAASTAEVYFICLKVTGGAFKVGTFLTKTTTGTQADISGMSAAPALVMYLPSFLTSANGLDTIIAATTCESTGLGVAVNNGGSTEYGTIAMFNNDGTTLGNTSCKCVTSNTKAGFIFGGGGALAVDWNINSWDSGGITNNYVTADATARYVGYLAIAPTAAAALDPIRLVWRK